MDSGRQADPVDDLLSMFNMPEASKLPGRPDAAAPESEGFSAAENPSASSAAPTPRMTPATPAAQSEATPSGEHFIAWLRQRIASRVLIINDARALVHTVSDTVYLASPGIFQRYAQEHPRVGALAKLENQSDWQWVQKRFEKLGLHRKQANGLNIWTCEVAGPRKTRRLHGYLLQDPQCLFDEIPPNNPYLTVR
jgi:hypothetical protein